MTLTIRTLGGVKLPVQQFHPDETVAELRARVASHFGPAASCRLFCNGSKLSDRLKLDAICLQPGQFLVAMETKRKRGNEAVASTRNAAQPAMDSSQSHPTTQQHQPMEPQQPASQPCSALDTTNAAGARAIEASGQGCHAAAAVSKQASDALQPSKPAQADNAATSDKVAAVVCRPEEPSGQLAPEDVTQRIQQAALLRAQQAFVAAQQPATVSGSHIGSEATKCGPTLPLRRRLMLPPLPLMSTSPQRSSLPAMQQGSADAAAVTTAREQSNGTTAALQYCVDVAASGHSPKCTDEPMPHLIQAAPPLPAPAPSQLAREQTTDNTSNSSVKTVSIADTANGMQEHPDMTAMSSTRPRDSQGTDLWSALSRELRMAPILQPASAPKSPTTAQHTATEVAMSTAGSGALRDARSGGPAHGEQSKVTAQQQTAFAGETPGTAARSVKPRKRRASQGAKVSKATTSKLDQEPIEAPNQQLAGDDGQKIRRRASVSKSKAVIPADEPSNSKAATKRRLGADVVQQWEENVRVAPNLTTAQAALVATLPLPAWMDQLEDVFSALTTVYGFLLRQHIQPTWQAVAALLPDLPAGAGSSVDDVELMARLAPDVLVLRCGSMFGSPVKSMVQRRAAATAAAVAVASRPVQPRALFKGTIEQQTPSDAATAGSTAADAPSAPDPSPVSEKGGGVSGGGSLAACWAEHQRIFSTAELQKANAARQPEGSKDGAEHSNTLEDMKPELIGSKVFDADICRRVNGLLEVRSDGAGTLMAGVADRRVVEIVDPGRGAVPRVANRSLLGADSDTDEAGLDSGGLGASRATRAGQTEGGARNASQRRCRAFRHALVRAVNLVHAACLKQLTPSEPAAEAPQAETEPLRKRRKQARSASDDPEQPKAELTTRMSDAASSLAAFDVFKAKGWHPSFDVDSMATRECVLVALESAPRPAPPVQQQHETPTPSATTSKGSSRDTRFQVLPNFGQGPSRPPQVHKKHPPCRQTCHLESDAFLQHLQERESYEGQAVHFEKVPARLPKYRIPSVPLSPPVQRAIASIGVSQLFLHQALAIDAVQQAHNVVVSTSTASGKSLCYLLPVLEALAKDRNATALFMFPTKALAQDQLRAMRGLVKAAFGEDRPPVDVFDGDTPQWERPEIKDRAQLLITNPDMIHVSVLPAHPSFARFLANLRFVIVDEGHAYRGVFGCHTALVIRRLRRICERCYRSSPTFVVTSATVANPKCHVQDLLGLQDVVVVSEDGSPHGPKTIVMWNPSLLQPNRGKSGKAAASGNGDARSNPLKGVPLMSRTESRARKQFTKRAAREWQRNQARDANQERGRGGQINEAAGISEADMLAAAAVGRRHAAVQSASTKTLNLIRADQQADKAERLAREAADDEMLLHLTPHAVAMNELPPSPLQRPSDTKCSLPSKAASNKPTATAAAGQSSILSNPKQPAGHSSDVCKSSQPMMQPTSSVVHVAGPVVPGNVLDLTSSAAAAAAVAGAAAPPQPSSTRVWKPGPGRRNGTSTQAGSGNSSDSRGGDIDRGIIHRTPAHSLVQIAAAFAASGGPMSSFEGEGHRPQVEDIAAQQPKAASQGLSQSLSTAEGPIVSPSAAKAVVKERNSGTPADMPSNIQSNTHVESTPQDKEGEEQLEVDEAGEVARPLQNRLPGAEWRERCGPQGMPADQRRSSPIVELSLLLVTITAAECIQHGRRTLAFCKTRKLCELVTAYTRETLRDTAPHLTPSISVYRGGYSPQERREIEGALMRGELRAVCATNALELGVDVGGLDVTLHLGFPGSVASFWQQAGRAGRHLNASASIYIAFDGPLDQYFMTDPQRLFSRPIEAAQVDPSNVLLMGQHASCAAQEAPLLPSSQDIAFFGPTLPAVAATLEKSGHLSRDPRDPGGEALMYTGPHSSAASAISLRAIDPDRFTIINEAAGGEVMEEIEESKAFYEVYDGAVYMFQGRSYLCKRLDLVSKTAVVRPADVKYYTKVRDYCDVHVTGGRSAYEHQMRMKVGAVSSAVAAECEVTNRWLGFHRIWHGSGEIFDTVDLFLPDVQFNTQAAYIRVPSSAREAVRAAGLPFRDGLHAASHAVLNVLPAFMMCADSDMQAECDNPYDTRFRPERILIYDTHPGGIGLAAQAAPLFPVVMEKAAALVRACTCVLDTGCPGCVQHTHCNEYNAVLSKASAIIVLDHTLAAEAARLALSRGP